jgi:hypothetical protein
MWTIDLPLRVLVSKNNWFQLNLNGYRNAHFRTLDKAKKLFADLAEPLIRHLPKLGRVHITYTVYMPSNRRYDTANVCSIVDKFFSDVLVSCGKLTDDNSEVLLSTTYVPGGVDRGNPRVEATIELADPANDNIKPKAGTTPSTATKDTNLKIQIVETELHAAIRTYVRSMIAVQPGNRIDIELRATRGDDGFIANIDILPDGTAPAVAAEVTKAVPVTTPAKGGLFTKHAEMPAPAPIAVDTAEIVQETVEPEPTVEAEPEPTPVVEVRTSVFSTNAGRDTVDEPDEDAGEGETPLKPSIFSGLRRPVNSSAEAALATA